jgi:DNA-binding transcriptional MerR regulator
LDRFEAAPGVLYTLDTAAHLAGVSRRTILLYCKWGLIDPVRQPPFGVMHFSVEAIRTVRTAEYLATVLGVNPPGIRVAIRLLHELEDLRRARGPGSG